MKIAYNPLSSLALTAAPAGNDITFDLPGINIYVRGVRFKGTDTTYNVFKKHTSSGSGGYNGLVPVPSHTTTSVRYLREDGTWQVPIPQVISSTYTQLSNEDFNSLREEGRWYFISGSSTTTNGPTGVNNGAELYIGRNASGYRYLKVITAPGIVWFRYWTSTSWSSWVRWYTDANTDKSVLLAASTTANFRPVILGYTNTNTPSDLSANVTQLVYTTTTIYAQPSTGSLWANKLYSGGKPVLTEHQSLANYVTLNTALTITGVKTFSTGPILANNAIITLNLNSTSNYTTVVKWLKEGTSLGTYNPSIGQHNTGGDGTGSICILPYPTSTAPWGGTVGLFISKGVLRLDGKAVAIAENYYTKTESDNRYVNVTGDTMTGPLIVKASITGTLLISNIADGTAPLKVTSKTVVTNLNSDLLDGYHETSFFRARGSQTIASSIPTTTELSSNNNLSGNWNVTFPGASGHLVQFNTGTGSTRYMQFYSYYSGSLYWRNSTDSTLNTKSWKTIVDSANYTGIVLKIGTATKGSATLPIYLNAGTPTACSTTLGVSITGNAATATKLLTARTINGTSFNGTANITTAYWGTTRTITLSGAVTGSASVNGSLNVTITTTYQTGSIDGRYVGGNKTANHGSSGTAYTADTYSSNFVNKAFVAYAERGSWAYANNGYITTDTGVNIPLAGTAIFQWGASDTNKTLLFITPSNSSGVSNPAANDMLFYTSNGSGYTSAWTRVLTHRNYTAYTVTKTGGGASGTWGISITGSAPWANITGKPTTLSGYGITDAYSKTQTDAKYLPLTGGTLTGALKLKTNSLTRNIIYSDSGTDNMIFGDVNGSTGIRGSNIFFQNSVGNSIFQINKNVGKFTNTPLVGTNKIWHAGNDGAGSGLDADMLDGHNSSYFLGNNSIGNIDFNTVTQSGIYRLNGAGANSPGTAYGQMLVLHGAADTIAQLAIAYSNSTVKVRAGNPTNVGGSGTWGAWNTVAFTTSNVASATKLQTTRTIWGQSFNGSGNVSGALTGVSTISASGTVTAPTFIGSLSGNASSATTATTANRLNRLGDNRGSFSPSAIAGRSLVATFSTQGALVNQVNDYNYSDVIAISTYQDSSAGQVNALSFDKSSYRINHFMGTFGASTWSGFKTLAYLTDNVTSATKLQTTRTINGTSFNGTANITTLRWGYARTLTLTGAVTGSVSIDGSGNVSLGTTYLLGNIGNLDTRYVRKTGDSMSGYLTINTNGVYVKFGCLNGSHAHYETNASTSHYFNKAVDVNGVIRVYNTGTYMSGTGFYRNGSSNSYLLLGGGGHKLITDFAKGNAGASNRGVYVINGTVTAMTYYLNTTVNSGTSGKLAYYSGATILTSYTNTVGSVHSPVYMNAGVPTICSYYSFLGAPLLPVVLVSGYFYRSATTSGTWLYTGYKHSLIGSPTFYINGGVMRLTFSNSKQCSFISAAAQGRLNFSGANTYSLQAYDGSNGNLGGRSTGAYWFNSVVTNSGNTSYLYVRAYRLADSNNDAWYTGNGCWGLDKKAIHSVSFTIFGFIYP